VPVPGVELPFALCLSLIESSTLSASLLPSSRSISGWSSSSEHTQQPLTLVQPSWQLKTRTTRCPRIRPSQPPLGPYHHVQGQPRRRRDGPLSGAVGVIPGFTSADTPRLSSCESTSLSSSVVVVSDRPGSPGTELGSGPLAQAWRGRVGWLQSAPDGECHWASTCQLHEPAVHDVQPLIE
jgi:hypothetical protein